MLLRALVVVLTLSPWALTACGHPPAAGYPERVARVQQRREAVARRYRQASTPAQRQAALREARHLFIASLDTVLWPSWYGTPWEFYGQTRQPGTGAIACGYFVTAALHDAGLHLDRHLAQLASSQMIKRLTTAPHIHVYRKLTPAQFERQLRALGDGVYIVGLDFHVGFLLQEQGRGWFIHSSYIDHQGVVREPVASSRALRSNVRFVGKISADDQLLRRWLLGQAIGGVVPQ